VGVKLREAEKMFDPDHTIEIEPDFYEPPDTSDLLPGPLPEPVEPLFDRELPELEPKEEAPHPLDLLPSQVSVSPDRFGFWAMFRRSQKHYSARDRKSYRSWRRIPNPKREGTLES
jgi:hypothetical protein